MARKFEHWRHLQQEKITGENILDDLKTFGDWLEKDAKFEKAEKEGNGTGNRDSTVQKCVDRRLPEKFFLLSRKLGIPIEVMSYQLSHLQGTNARG